MEIANFDIFCTNVFYYLESIFDQAHQLDWQKKGEWAEKVW